MKFRNKISDEILSHIDFVMFVWEESERQFEYVSTEFDFKVIYHKKTKIMYAVSSGYYTYGNLTVLVDAEGKPLLYEEE